MRHAKYFLGLELTQSSNGMFLNQRKYIKDLIADVALQNVKVVSTPMIKNLRLNFKDGELLPDP